MHPFEPILGIEWPASFDGGDDVKVGGEIRGDRLVGEYEVIDPHKMVSAEVGGCGFEEVNSQAEIATTKTNSIEGDADWSGLGVKEAGGGQEIVVVAPERKGR